MNIEQGPEGIVLAEGTITHAVTQLRGREVAIASAIALDHRRASFISGRVAARAAVTALRPGLDQSTVEILAASDGAPEAFTTGSLLDLSVSIAHRGERVFAAAAASPAVVGCDVERIEARSSAFVDDYLTSEESIAVRRSAQPELTANLAWCVKEAVLKVRRTGLRRDTRTVVVDIESSDAAGEVPGSWSPIPVRDVVDSAPVRVWWRVRDGYVYTIAVG